MQYNDKHSSDVSVIGVFLYYRIWLDRWPYGLPWWKVCPLGSVAAQQNTIFVWATSSNKTALLEALGAYAPDEACTSAMFSILRGIPLITYHRCFLKRWGKFIILITYIYIFIFQFKTIVTIVKLNLVNSLKGLEEKMKLQLFSIHINVFYLFNNFYLKKVCLWGLNTMC